MAKERLAQNNPHGIKSKAAALVVEGWTWYYTLSRVTPALIAEKRDNLLNENIGSDETPRHRTLSTANRCLAALSKSLHASGARGALGDVPGQMLEIMALVFSA